MKFTAVIIITIVFSVLQVSAQTSSEAKYKPSFKISVCESAQDKFLCEALVKAKELLEQQINCEVTQRYIQKNWDGAVITEKPDYYYVRVEKNQEIFYKIGKHGKLSGKKSRPDFQTKPVYATAGWYEKPLAVISKGKFTKAESFNQEEVAYNFRADKALLLVHHEELWINKVMSSIFGTIIFDRKSKLIKKINLTHDIQQKEREKHKFRFLEEETVFGIPDGFEEASPMPIHFQSKMDFLGTKVIIDVEYSNYRLFTSDIVFKSAEDQIVEDSLPTLVSKKDFRIRNELENKPKPSEISSKIDNSKFDPKPIYDRAKDITGKFLIAYKDDKNKERYRQCTIFLYDKLQTNNNIRLFFMTNNHCVLGFISGKITSALESFQVKEENLFRIGSDAAVIEVFTENKRWIDLNTNFQFTSPKFDDTLLTVGFPQDVYTEGAGKVSGMVNAKDGEIEVVGAKVIDLPSKFGASGSPIFDKYFRFAGLRFSGTNKDTLGNYTSCEHCSKTLFIDGKVIYDLLKQNNLIFR